MEPELQAVLEPKEQVIWEGRQEIKSAMTSAICISLLIFLFGYLFFYVSGSSSGSCTINGQIASPESCGKTFSYVTECSF